jgi:iron complex transport system ATP-binding protein
MAGNVIELSRVEFSRGDLRVLGDVSWSVKAGEIAAVLGANGCGKSTLLRVAVGYLWPQRGEVRLLGEKLGEVELAPLRKRVGIVEATTVYPFDETMTALEVVVSGYFSALTVGYVHPTEEMWGHSRELLKRVGLGDREEQLYATLSTGQRMRALIARGLVRKPELLILDEPTAGLDLPSREAVLATLARLHPVHPLHPPTEGGRGRPALVTVTHHLEELLPGTSNVLLLSTEGRVVASGAAEAVLTSAHMTAAYGVKVEVERRNGRWSAHVDPGLWGEMV